MSFYLKYTVALFLVLFGFKNAFTQQKDNFYLNTPSPEKIYLQLDKDLYITSSTIWFKAIVTKAFNNTPTDLSSVLYVELIDSNETILEKKLIKINKGIGEGYFDLPQKLTVGSYLIRAYTQWNKNFGNDFFFEKYIKVISTSGNSNLENAIDQITLVREASENNLLKANLNPTIIDELHKNKVTVNITIDNLKDSISTRKEKNDIYEIEYSIPKESQLATIEMVTSNNKKYSKTIVLDEESIDLQFFPESGELVHGIGSKIGFKALDAYGLGKYLEGDIIDENNNVITTFKSNALGMGSFTLNNVDSTQTYYARVISDSTKVENRYPLPKIAPLGNVLSVLEKDRSITVNTTSNYLKNDSIYLNVSFGGATIHEVMGKLKNGNLTFLFSGETLPEGILAFTMLNTSKQVVAERLFFNQKLGTDLNIDIATNKPSYAKRELTNLSINTTTKSGEPIKANTSVLVINKEQLGTLQQKRDNILSYFLLSSELKGHIENPGYYFNGTQDKRNDLDALMITQGWRKYIYQKPTNMRKFYPEVSLNVSGHVTAALSQNRRRKAEITMMTFGKSKDIYAQTTDSLGNFQFNLFDEYGKDMGIVLQSAKKSGKKVNYNFFIDREKSPIISFNHKNTVVPLDSVADSFIKKEAERQFVYGDFSFDGDNIALDEVIIEAYKMTPNRKKVMDRFGEPDVVINGDKIAEEEQKWSYGLYSVLMFSFSDKLRIIRDSNGKLYPMAFNREPTLVVIDGIPLRPYEFELAQSIPPDEVSSVELIEYAKNFASLYCDVFPYGCIEPPRWGNVLAIYTHGQKGIYNANSPMGILKTSIPVFSQTKEFYAPKYDASFTDDLQKPDLRALVHWQPILETNDDGTANISFYNADVTGEIMVVVEAITEDGEIGYQEFIYKVE
ncbi:hypothetical protein KO566_07105 [Flavobacteriaceae bacterium XHP0103]|uniref:hypothetical protein n=1 Tax=Marixanthotalea marina TaxID=2844359 RepID=UPI002989DADA|nr:hypothetical protein [Marixanthotalea marina]MBU3821824.1 hypothetical protein [Marixanthotalea marina]